MDKPHGPVRALPNLLSLSRIIMAPLMVVAAAAGAGRTFTALYAACLFTDAIDGFIARRLHVETPLGATLDSRGDLAVTLCLPIGALLLWPDMIRSLVPYIVAALAAYLAPCVVGELRYRRLPSFHTWGAKAMAVVVGISLLVMFVTQNTLWFRLTVPLLLLESVEELIMIAILPTWHPNTPSLWHAIRIRRSEKLRLNVVA
jgi:phosphatidylglycerophosphate synthase